MSYHLPVLLQQSIDLLDIKADGTYVDATFGGGGHSRLILEHLGPKGLLLAFDQDEDAKANVPQDDRLVFIPQNFSDLSRWVRVAKTKGVDGILADLGVSSHQINEAERGFSYRFDAALDMRMNQNQPLSAADLVNELSQDELQLMFGQLGEVRNARTLARKIVETRDKRALKTISDLLNICEPLVMGHRPRYLAQVFQALRIAVNDELNVLKSFLQQSLELLPVGGRIVVISYHSLEDRLVKNFFNSGNFENALDTDFYGNIKRPFQLLTKKAIEPSEQELIDNPRSRSARLRAAIKK